MIQVPRAAAEAYSETDGEEQSRVEWGRGVEETLRVHDRRTHEDRTQRRERKGSLELASRSGTHVCRSYVVEDMSLPCHSGTVCRQALTVSVPYGAGVSPWSSVPA